MSTEATLVQGELSGTDAGFSDFWPKLNDVRSIPTSDMGTSPVSVDLITGDARRKVLI